MAALWTLARLERAVETFSGQLQCAICLCAYENPVSLPCNHFFCEECIHRALELKTLCPICKTPANKRRLRYDTTLRELLRAMEMLSAAPGAVAIDKTVAAKEEVPSKREVAKVADPQPSLRRSRRNSTATSSLSIDVQVDGKAPLLGDHAEIKEERNAVLGTDLAERRSSPRRALLQDVKSPTTQLDPLTIGSINMATPRCVNARACKTIKGDSVETVVLQPHIDIDDGKTVNVVAARTQLDDVVEQKQQRTTRRRRQLRMTSDTVQDDDTQRVPNTRLRSATNQVVVAGINPEMSSLQTPTLRKRRRSAIIGVAPDAVESIALKKKAVSSGQTSPRLDSAGTLSLAVDYQTQPLPNVEAKVIYQVGDLVDVIERQWVGINKRGGAARITKVHGDGFYAVRFVMGCKDKCVPESYIRRPAEELIAETTPSHVVKQRLRRRVSNTIISPDSAATKTKGSTDTSEVKVKKVTKQKRSGMVFLCSGFEKQRMQQINEWADELEAEVVQFWTHDVTHLIVECIHDDDVEDGDSSIEDFDSSSSQPEHHHDKPRLFINSKSGRWVKTRSLKYLKALVGGRWIVSDEWLQGQ
uniref:RING-type domain-containing protein n=1 Tax=Hyaloperonospora arabidopsidis (strain Emoy2) TaxID=559515 RepID=M4BTF2_HYAAE